MLVAHGACPAYKCDFARVTRTSSEERQRDDTSGERNVRERERIDRRVLVSSNEYIDNWFFFREFVESHVARCEMPSETKQAPIRADRVS